MSVNSTLFDVNNGSVWRYKNGYRMTDGASNGMYHSSFAMGKQNNDSYDVIFWFDQRFKKRAGLSDNYDLTTIRMEKAQLFLYPKNSDTFNLGTFTYSLGRWANDLSRYAISEMTVSNNSMVIQQSTTTPGEPRSGTNNSGLGYQNFLNHLKGIDDSGDSNGIYFYNAQANCPYTEFYGCGETPAHPPTLVGFWEYISPLVENNLNLNDGDIPLTSTSVQFTVRDSTANAKYKIIASLDGYSEAIHTIEGAADQKIFNFTFPAEWLQYNAYAQLMQVNFECKRIGSNNVETSLEKFTIVFKVDDSAAGWNYSEESGTDVFIDYTNKYTLGLDEYILSGKTNAVFNPNVIKKTNNNNDAAFLTDINVTYNSTQLNWHEGIDSTGGTWVQKTTPTVGGTDLPVSCTIVDSRLYKTSLGEKTITATSYTPPTILTSISATRFEQTDVSAYAPSPAGEYIGLSGEVQITAIAGNTLQYNIIGDAFQSDKWVTVDNLTDGRMTWDNNRAIFGDERTVAADQNKEYTISFRDGTGETVAQLLIVSGGKIVVHFPPEKTGIAFGGISTSDKNNPKAEFYYPIIANNGLNAIGATSYSTDETATGGTWIDGKKLYQKTSQFTISTNNSTDYNMTIANVDQVIKIDGFYRLKNSGVIRPLNWFYNDNQYTYTHYNVDTNNNRLVVTFRAVYSSDANGTLYITATYTKTTDGD